MNQGILEILKMVGDSSITERLPYGDKIVKLINRYVSSEEEKLPDNVTGTQALAYTETMPPAMLAQLLTANLEHELAMDTNWLAMQRMLNASDDNGKSTRPIAAILMAVVVTLFVVAYSVAMLINVWKHGTMPTWESITAALSIPSLVLMSYFGKRTQDKANRISAAMGSAPQATMAQMLLKRIGLLK